MYRLCPTQSSELTLDQLEDARDLRAVITAALAAEPIDEESLRRGVWTYVRAERDVGASAANVIAALTALVDAWAITQAPVRQFVTRQVILWCVEAYFGYLGGEVVGGGHDVGRARSASVPPMMVSNR
jgi:hypothetical protein